MSRKTTREKSPADCPVKHAIFHYPIPDQVENKAESLNVCTELKHSDELHRNHTRPKPDLRVRFSVAHEWFSRYFADITYYAMRYSIFLFFKTKTQSVQKRKTEIKEVTAYYFLL